MLNFFSKKFEKVKDWLKNTAFEAVKTAPKNHTSIVSFSKPILCVDDDPDFCSYFKSIAEGLHVTIECARTVAEAKKKIEDKEYSAFIIDGHLPDGSGFDLVAWIREQQDIRAPIGFISRIYHDASSFRLLKEKLHVDYVLEKPLNLSDTEMLLKKLCGVSRSLDNPTEYYLGDIQKEYQRTFYDKIALLQKLIIDVQRSASLESLKALKTEVHKISGSAGSFGFPQISEVCKELEIDLTAHIDMFSETPPTTKWLASLEDFFHKIKRFAQ